MNYVGILAGKYTENYKGFPIICWEGIILCFVESIINGICFFLSFYLVNQLKINLPTTGLIISSYGLGTMIGGFISGRLSDKMPPKTISIVCLFIQACTFFCLAYTEKIPFLFACFFVIGLTAYGFITSNNTQVLRYCKKNEVERLKVINILRTISNLGIGCAAILIGWFAYYGFHNIFIFSGVLVFFAAIYLVSNKKSVYEKFYLSKIENDSEVLQATQDEIAKNKIIIAIVLSCIFFIGLVVAQRRVTYPVYLHQSFDYLGMHGLSFLLALNPILIILFQPWLINCFSAKNKLLMTGIGGCLMGFGMCVLSISIFFSMAVAACIVYTFGEMLFFSMAQLVCYQKSPPGKKGQSLGLFQSSYAASVVIGPTIGGIIYHYGGSSSVWYMSGLIGLLCFFICFCYQKTY